MSATGRSDVRALHDFYRTPDWSTRAILRHLPSGGEVLDAGCGDGAILKVLLDTAPFTHGQTSAIELVPELAAAARRHFAEPRAHHVFDGDFLTHQVPYDLIVSNPPYSLAQPFVEHALELVAPYRGTVAMLLRLGWLAGQKRVAFHRANPCDVFVLARRPSFTPDGGTDASEYAWMVWGPGRGGRLSILDGVDEVRA